MIKSWYDEVKEDFVKNINDTYTLNLAVSILEDRQNLLDETLKYKEVINKVIKYIEENKQHEYRNGNFNEYYLELNEKEMTELLDILKEVEHE